MRDSDPNLDAIVHDTPPIDDHDDFSGGNTRAHYLPVEPRKPARTLPPCRSRGCLAPLSEIDGIDVCIMHPADAAVPRDDRPSAPALPPPPPIAPRLMSIAEAFQDMLRQTFMAGIAAAQSGETFETWYQREVLR